MLDLIVGADNQDRYAEDSPVRLMLFFDGDKTTLPFKEQVLMDTAKLLTGPGPPVRDADVHLGEPLSGRHVLPNSFTSQVKLLVAGSGAGSPGSEGGKQFERNYVDDYRQAFGASPGRLIGVGIMTDTDNTGERIDAYYGDIELKRAP